VSIITCLCFEKNTLLYSSSPYRTSCYRGPTSKVLSATIAAAWKLVKSKAKNGVDVAVLVAVDSPKIEARIVAEWTRLAAEMTAATKATKASSDGGGGGGVDGGGGGSGGGGRVSVFVVEGDIGHTNSIHKQRDATADAATTAAATDTAATDAVHAVASLSPKQRPLNSREKALTTFFLLGDCDVVVRLPR
jgi:hypothetical protein